MKGEARRSVPDRDQDEKVRNAAPPPRATTSPARWAWEWTKSILIAFALFLVIRTFLVEAFRIPTGSMERTLLVGDFLLVNKAVYGAQLPGTAVRLPAFDRPRRGDIVVFTPPHEPGKNYVKRLIGLPGDTLFMRDKVLYVNGQAQIEPFVTHSDPHGDIFVPGMMWQREHLVGDADGATYRPTRDNWGPLLVSTGHFFVLGDNRDDSEDSRYWGFVDKAAIKGQPLFIYYSFDPNTMRPFPWLTEIRWGRIGGTVH
ncbi:MAG: signal peptidase I [Gemmatimonadetes bacterium]|nr:signal peptidase I [Gemmatimonadota bacterium]